MGFSLKRMFKPPKWIRKMKPLKVLGKVAPFAAMAIPGLGPLAAAGIGAAGGLLRGGGIGGAIQGGLMGGAGSALLGGQGLKGIGGLLGRAKGALGSVGGALKSAALPAAQRVLGGGGAPSYENAGDPYGIGDASAAADAAIAGTPIGGATQATQATGGGRGLLGGIGNLLGRAGKGVVDWVGQNPMTALGAGSAILGSIGAAKTGNEAEQAMRAATFDPDNPYHNPNARRRGAVQTANAALGGY